MANKVKTIKLLMLMSNLDDLGVQRVVLNLYKHLPPEVEPIIVFWRNEGKISQFFVPRGKVYETDRNRLPLKSFFRLFAYRKIIRAEKPDVILSFIPGTNISLTFLKPFISKVPLIASEHAFISKAFEIGEYRGAFGYLYRRLIPYMYNKVFNKLVMTANVGKADAIENWKINPKQIEVIYNPQDIAEIQERATHKMDDNWFNKDVPIIIGAGRLAPQKGFDKLLDAFALLVQDKEAKLAILGRGDLEDDLKARCEKHNLGDKVKFFGFQTNHLKYFKNASIFALSSVWEAMPMVVAEAMVVGVPIVSFDCPSGPKELLDNGNRGLLVKDQDVNELAKSLEYVINNYECALGKAATGKKWAEEELNAVSVTNRYLELIKRIL